MFNDPRVSMMLASFGAGGLVAVAACRVLGEDGQLWAGLLGLGCFAVALGMRLGRGRAS